jgi:hypothetical protein
MTPGRLSLVAPAFLALFAACAVPDQNLLHTPPEQAAWFKFPYELPQEGLTPVPGVMATALQLAMDDFLPWSATAPRGATPAQVCLQQRQSYDVKAAAHSADIILVRISRSPGACLQEGPTVDGGALYAIDVRSWRVLAVQAL